MPNIESNRSEPDSSAPLGVPTMDASHRRLAAALAAVAAVPDVCFAEAFGALVAAVERDFHAEEEMMEAIAFPGLKAHREQHARLLGGLHHADPFVRQGDSAQGRTALTLLPQWFALHEATMDRALAEAVLDGPLIAARPGPADTPR